MASYGQGALDPHEPEPSMHDDDTDAGSDSGETTGQLVPRVTRSWDPTHPSSSGQADRPTTPQTTA